MPDKYLKFLIISFFIINFSFYKEIIGYKNKKREKNNSYIYKIEVYILLKNL